MPSTAARFSKEIPSFFKIHSGLIYHCFYSRLFGLRRIVETADGDQHDAIPLQEVADLRGRA
jgi:hypothetical protein